MNIGATIKVLRKERKIRQGELADLCGISQNAMSQVESNKRLVRASNLEKICQQLDITVGGLYIMAITEQDIHEGKIEVFKAIRPLIKSIFFDK